MRRRQADDELGVVNRDELRSVMPMSRPEMVHHARQQALGQSRVTVGLTSRRTIASGMARRRLCSAVEIRPTQRARRRCAGCRTRCPPGRRARPTPIRQDDGGRLAAGLRAPFLAGASVFLILAMVLFRVSIASDRGACPPPLMIRSPWRDSTFLVFVAAMTGWWVMFAQLSVGFPLRAAAVGGPRTVTLAVIVNAAFGLGAMPLVGYTLRRCKPGSGLRIGLALAAVGFALTGNSPASFPTS